MSYALETEAALIEVGQPVTLRRPGAPNIDVTLSARILGVNEQEIGGGVTQADRQVICGNLAILAAGWPGPPRRGDLVIANGKTSTIQAVDTVQVGSEVVRHNLLLRGS